jgi:hypothetical protein
MRLTRRFFATTIPLVLAACATTVTAPTLGTIASDVSLALSGLQKAMLGIEAAAPNLVSAADQATITSVIAAAQGLATSLSSATPTASGATTVQTIDGDINTVLNIAAAIPLIPQPYDLAVEAVATLAPLLEAFVNSTLGLASAVKSPLRAKLTPNAMSADQARSVLWTFLAAK